MEHQGGDCASPFILPLGPSILGIGFLFAFAVLMRGTPWMTRGSFIRVGSSLAGTTRAFGQSFRLCESSEDKNLLLVMMVR